MMAPGRVSVAFFMHDLSGGGVERMRLRLIGALAAGGHCVTLIVQSETGSLAGELPDGVRVVVLGHRHVLTCIPALAAAIRRLRPDVLVSSLDHNNIAAICACRLSGRHTKVVICQHNALSAERALGWKYRVVPLLYRLLAPFAHGIIAVSEGVADDLATITGIARKRVSVIYNPVIGPDFVPRLQASAPHPWLENGAVPVFVFAGRLVPQKNPLLLLSAFAMRFAGANARLIVLGEGPLLEPMRAQVRALGIETQVHFGGFVADSLPWIMHAYALVLPSSYEGFGNVIVEAMACGTPVIATDCPHGPAEILDDGRFGRLVPVADSAALADAMTDDLRDMFPAALLHARAAIFGVEASAVAHEKLFAALRAPVARRAFGMKLTRLDAAGVVDRCMETSPPDGPGLVVTPNLDHLRLLRSRDFAAAYKSAVMICPDGSPVAAYAWLRGAAARRRVTGCDIIHHLLGHPALSRRRVAVVVESVSTHAALADWLGSQGLGTFWCCLPAPPGLARDEAGQRRLVASIRAFNPEILIMTLGAPVSEVFVHRHREDLPPCWALCVGQALRVELGLARRAPLEWRQFGLEWAWRLWREPRRLTARYVKAALWFPLAVLMDLAG